MRSESYRLYKKEWYLKNKERLSKKAKENYENDKENRIKKAKEWSEKNLEKRRDIEKRHRDKARESRKRYNREYHQSHKSDPAYRIKRNIRIRISDFLSGRQSSRGVSCRLGCDLESLRFHLESQFTDGMSWENYGRYGWHVDHIIPVSYAIKDGNIDEEMMDKICHYSNLRPLWAKDNYARTRKGIKDEYPIN